MLLINTRPADRAQILTEQLQALGHCVLELPLLYLKPVVMNSTLKAQFLQLPMVDALVVVSPTAAKIGLQYLNDLSIPVSQLSGVSWIAVGEETANILRHHGVEVDVPAIENSEGMLQLPVLAQSTLKTVAFWRGHGGRQFMMSKLISDGVSVLNCLLYERSLPESSLYFSDGVRQQIDQYLKSDKIYVCVSSEASWLHWQQICREQLFHLTDFYYLTLGQRLTEIVREVVCPDQDRILIIDDLKPATIHAVML